MPPVRHWPSVSAPFAAPATCMPGGIVPGVNAAISSVHTGLPPRWQVRCTAGFQPPDTASASHSIFVVRPLLDHVDRLDAKPAMHMRDLCAGHRPDAERAEFARRFGARVDHRHDLDPRGVRIGRRAPAVVIVGEDRDAPPRRSGVAVDGGAHRARHHHARAIVVAERDHALVRACRQHRALRHDLPVPLARLVLRRQPARDR